MSQRTVGKLLLNGEGEEYNFLDVEILTEARMQFVLEEGDHSCNFHQRLLELSRPIFPTVPNLSPLHS